MAISLNNHESRIKTLESSVAAKKQLWIPIVCGNQESVQCSSTSFAVSPNCTKLRVYLAGNRTAGWSTIYACRPTWEGWFTSGYVNILSGYQSTQAELRLSYMTSLNGQYLFTLTGITSTGDNFVFIEGLYSF